MFAVSIILLSLLCCRRVRNTLSMVYTSGGLMVIQGIFRNCLVKDEDYAELANDILFHLFYSWNLPNGHISSTTSHQLQTCGVGYFS